MTVWASFSLTVPTVTVLEQASASGVTTTVALEAAGLLIFAGTIGTVFFGVFFLPAGLLTGYVLGRARATDPEPVPVLRRFR